ncbi:hypothetical protein LJR034_001329 [Caballeronia sp. LjRoot34]|uniref:hypothetical protein n=1 Tax=Caballeronia sp. LjRoot34 TaxID=3342325 RepID=UPI003ECF2717
MTTLLQLPWMLLRGLPPAALTAQLGLFSPSWVPGTDAGFRAVSPLGRALDLVVRALAG